MYKRQAVHCCNGIWGTIAVGLFATTSAPESTLTGLFYGGGFDLLIKQLTGVLSVGIWTAITITITFFIIKKISRPTLYRSGFDSGHD